MQRILIWFVCVLFTLLVAAGLVLYTMPFGSGEYQTSPDGGFCAEATTYTQRRLFAPTRLYQSYQIRANACEQNQGKTLWQLEYEPAASEPLDYGMRGQQFITWSPANTEVVFMLDERRSLTIPVP